MFLRGAEAEEPDVGCSILSSDNGGTEPAFKDGTDTALSEELDFLTGLERTFKLSSPEDDFPVLEPEIDGVSTSVASLEPLLIDSPDLLEELDSLPLPREPLKFKRSLEVLSFCFAAASSEVDMLGELLSVMFLYKFLRSAKSRRPILFAILSSGDFGGGKFC